jgi:hypothetical protein
MSELHVSPQHDGLEQTAKHDGLEQTAQHDGLEQSRHYNLAQKKFIAAMI